MPWIMGRAPLHTAKAGALAKANLNRLRPRNFGEKPYAVRGSTYPWNEMSISPLVMPAVFKPASISFPWSPADACPGRFWKLDGWRTSVRMTISPASGDVRGRAGSARGAERSPGGVHGGGRSGPLKGFFTAKAQRTQRFFSKFFFASFAPLRCEM